MDETQSKEQELDDGAERLSPDSPRAKSTIAFFNRFVEPIEDRMIRSIWRVTRNTQDAEDAMQNSLVAIWRQRDLIASHATPQAFILRICLDAACDLVRKRSRAAARCGPTSDTDAVIDPAKSPIDAIADRELVERIVGELHQLPQQQAVAMALRAFEDLSYDEIASAMNCTPATVRKHVERARAKLQVLLTKYDLVLTKRRP